MSTETIHAPSSDLADKVISQAETEVAPSSPADQEPQDVLRWFDVVEIEELGMKAFVRLPNDYQHVDIREKALAAKARRIRQYKHPETDAFEVMDSELEEIASQPEDEAKESFVRELLYRDFAEDRQKAVREVIEDEEFAHVRKDQERLLELDALDPEGRSDDEYKEILDHLSKFAEAIDVKMADLREPRKQALMGLDVDDLKEQVREARVKQQGNIAFNDTYAFHQMLVGTLVVPEDFDPAHITPQTMPSERFFKSEDELRNYDPVAVTRLADAFESLEGNLAARAAGNS